MNIHEKNSSSVGSNYSMEATRNLDDVLVSYAFWIQSRYQKLFLRDIKTTEKLQLSVKLMLIN